MKLETAPFSHKITKNDGLTIPWQTWFRNLSKNLTDSCRIYESDNYAYSINNNILTILYDGLGNESLSLPFALAYGSFLQYLLYNTTTLNWDLKIIELEKGIQSISIPSGKIKIKDSLLIEQKNR